MKYYLIAFVVLTLTLVAHILGLNIFYATVPVYDIFMHILGGLGIGFFLYALGQSLYQNKITKNQIIVGVFLVGVVWEIFEIIYNIAGYPFWTKAYYLDTAKDLLDDVIGGAVACYCLPRNNSEDK